MRHGGWLRGIMHGVKCSQTPINHIDGQPRQKEGGGGSDLDSKLNWGRARERAGLVLPEDF
jgi:hypothetical protein